MIQNRKRNDERLIELGLGGPGTAAANAIPVIAPPETATVKPPQQPKPTELPSPSVSNNTIPELLQHH